MGQLWKFIEQHQDSTLYGASVREIARGAGIKESTLPRWQNLKRMPEPEHLRALARHINVPYRVLLDAALADTGYLDARPEREEGEDRGNAAPNTPAGDDPAPTKLELVRARQQGMDEAIELLGAVVRRQPLPTPSNHPHELLHAAYMDGWKSVTDTEGGTQALLDAWGAATDAPPVPSRGGPVATSASDSAIVTQFPSTEALDPTIPDDVAARSETGKGKAQRARERQDEETEGL